MSAVALALSGVFVTVAMVAGAAASWWLARTAPEARRLRTLALGPMGKMTGAERERQSLTDGPDPRLARLTRLLPKSPKDMSRLQRRLARAGYPRFKAAVYYTLAQLLLPFVLGGSVILTVGVSKGWIYAPLAMIVLQLKAEGANDDAS